MSVTPQQFIDALCDLRDTSSVRYSTRNQSAVMDNLVSAGLVETFHSDPRLDFLEPDRCRLSAAGELIADIFQKSEAADGEQS